MRKYLECGRHGVGVLRPTLALPADSASWSSVTLLLLRQLCPRLEKYQQLLLSVWYNLELSHSHQSQNRWPSHSCQGAMCQPQTPAPAPSFPALRQS